MKCKEKELKHAFKFRISNQVSFLLKNGKTYFCSQIKKRSLPNIRGFGNTFHFHINIQDLKISMYYQLPLASLVICGIFITRPGYNYNKQQSQDKLLVSNICIRLCITCWVVKMHFYQSLVLTDSNTTNIRRCTDITYI